MRSEERKKTLGEVFTPLPLVDEILSKIPPESWQEDKTFLDNSCGNGNFLVEVYKYKVERGHDPTKALSTIYGVDIMKDNIAECKLRLYKLAKEYGANLKECQRILNKNIVCHDALTYDYEFRDPLK